MITTELPAKRKSNSLMLVFKLLLTAACITYMCYKVDFSRVPHILRQVQLPWLFGALLSFSLSKVLSSLRLNIYFRQIGISLGEWANIRLYWLGMFFNLFLPGSIGGDAYKVIRVTGTYGISYKKTAAAVLLDRFSGLAGLGLITGAIWLILFKEHPLNKWIITGMILLIPVFYFAVKLLLPYLLPAFWSTFGWGILVQVFQVLTFYCVLISLGIHQLPLPYLFIFMLSSVAAVLPLTIGGMGIRETVFLWGAGVFSLDNNMAVLASLLFYITMVAASAFGLYFVFADSLKHKAIISND